ncbi:proline-rich receptor-like protein kinase PERK12 isoform X1 [Cucurbita maxima]|uniref:Proline-rich receptor-like protein kinase PERK12 isoform X1 n=1 Tax=Cucurbita maxima TaxID=3661 RepID=A0A6J1I8J4_CUCMA|nr:proline-rich receptor-like protein kinase PERK12 isoform X1 [Cucurbita maxima]XP_022973812.1 proline-rich receptor-like protein kinase PERK12 isoform X1 [Cucurbita maxima]XP_022973813.1 proline-rich receptor-like protein kinase PERK12 isoform X1 [Cucurbita maxima]
MLLPDPAAGHGGSVVVVGVRMELQSRELLTWALVKVAQPGDCVIALHVLDSAAVDEGKLTLLSLVKSFDSMLSAYEGFCNLKQVDLKLKVCRGSPVRKIIRREVDSYGEASLILGTSKSHHRIRSSASVAKYCARKLPSRFSVLAVNSGKVIFQRLATFSTKGQSRADKDRDKNCAAIVEVANEAKADGLATNFIDSHICLQKSDSGCNDKMERDSVEGTPSSLERNDSGTDLVDELPEDNAVGNSLAIVPFHKPQGSLKSNSIVSRESSHWKSSWPLLRRIFLSKQHVEKSSKKFSMFQGILHVSNIQSSSSALVYPDQKQNSSDQDQGSTIDRECGAIVPYGSGYILGSLPKEVLDLKDKYSSTCRLFTYEELLSATSNFMPENMVGKGGSSYVYRGLLPDGKEIAVKVLKPSENVLKEFVQEVGIIATSTHKNVISLMGFCLEDNNLLLVYGFLSRGSLEENLHGCKKDVNSFGWQERFKVAVGVAEALDYLHNCREEPVIHRDVKSSNILLSENFEPQLSDFGLASWASLCFQITCTDVAGTFGYLAPEYFMHGKVSDKIDVYAFGVVLLELLSGRKPITDNCPKGQESLVMWAKPILKEIKVSELLDPSLGSDYNDDQIGRMILAATLCIRRAPRLRPQISLVLKLLQGDEEITTWARQQIDECDEFDASDGEPLPTNIQSHLNLALLGLEDDSLSIGSGIQTISIEDYLQGRCSSRSSSFN